MFFTARTCTSPAAAEATEQSESDFAMPLSPSDKPVFPDIAPCIHKITELIRQLQDLEDRERSTIEDALRMDKLDIVKDAKSGGLFKKSKKARKPEVVIRLESMRMESLDLAKQALSLVRLARRTLGDCLTSVVYARALKLATTVSPAPSLTDEELLQTEGYRLPYLLGRCFNLSLNLKILKDCRYGDCSVSGRCYSDLSMLETHLDRLCIRRFEDDAVHNLKSALATRKKSATVENNFALKLKPVRKLLKLSAMTSSKT